MESDQDPTMSPTAVSTVQGDDGRGPSTATWVRELDMLDLATYAAVAATPTPLLDRVFRRLSVTADRWKLWLGCAALLAVAGGRRGRRAAVNGVAAMTVSSAFVHGVLKPVAERRRPDRALHRVPATRHVAMPTSTSFPSGHAATGAAFASGVAAAFPVAAIPLRLIAAGVSYSRVHTGVHYPVDVIVGSVTGTTLAPLAVVLVDRWRGRATRGRRRRRAR